MKLYVIDNSEMMEIKNIYREGDNIVVEGTIMGAMPIRSVVKPAEIRRALKMMSVGTLVFAASMLFRSSR
jgi:hypothetical protein